MLVKKIVLLVSFLSLVAILFDCSALYNRIDWPISVKPCVHLDYSVSMLSFVFFVPAYILTLRIAVSVL